MKQGTKQILSAVLLIASVALILWLTVLGREAQEVTPTVYYPFHSLGSFWKDIQHNGIKGNILGNILLFIPFGALVRIVSGWRALWKTAASGFVFSLLIETVQLLTKRGSFDLDDVLLNVAGTVIGCVIVRAVERLLKK